MGSSGLSHQEQMDELARARKAFRRAFWQYMLISLAYYNAIFWAMVAGGSVFFLLFSFILAKSIVPVYSRPWWFPIFLAIWVVALIPLHRLDKKAERRLEEAEERYEEAKCRQREHSRRRH